MSSRYFPKIVLTPFIFLAAGSAFAAFDANGVALGGTEAQVKKAFPSALCKPLAEAKEKIERGDKAAREVYKVRWESGADHAVLVSQLEKKRATLTVSRGNFEEEIYRIR